MVPVKIERRYQPQNIYISRPSHIFKDVLANDGKIAGRVKDNQRQFCPK